MINLHGTCTKFPNALYITPSDMIHKTTRVFHKRSHVTVFCDENWLKGDKTFHTNFLH